MTKWICPNDKMNFFKLLNVFLCWVGLGAHCTLHIHFLCKKNLVYSLAGQECYFHFVLIRSLVSIASNLFLSRPPFIIVWFLSFSNPNISSMGSFSSSWLLNQAMKTTPSWIHGSLAVLVPIHSCLLFVVVFFFCFSYWGQAGWIPGCTGSGAGGRTAPVSYMCTAPKTIFWKENMFLLLFQMLLCHTCALNLRQTKRIWNKATIRRAPHNSLRIANSSYYSSPSQKIGMAIFRKPPWAPRRDMREEVKYVIQEV